MRFFSSVQVVAMLFSKLKADANAALSNSEGEVTSCVIAVPSYFTSRERKSLLLAAAIAGLECEFLIKETTAVAINYGFYKKFSSTSNVVFIDFGHSSIQICACAFSDKRFEILAEVSKLIGGRDFDKKLTEHFIQELEMCKTKPKRQNFMHELFEEVKKLKEKMSANTGKLSLSIQHLPGFETTTLTIERAEMEAICKPLFDQVKDLLLQFLTESKLKPEEIQSVEVVGGSSRIPAFKELVRDVFGKAPQATMNQDEAVSRGCFFHSIMSKKMKDFIVIEIPVGEEQTLEGFLKVGEVHKYFKGDKNNNLILKNHDFEKIAKDESFMSMSDMNEKARRDARNRLDEFVTIERKQGGMLEVIDDEMLLRKVESIKSWDNGTTEKYTDRLDELTQRVNEMKNLKRSKARNKLHDFLRLHEKPAGVLAQIHDQEKRKEFEHDKNWNSGSISEYCEKYETWTVYVQNEKLRRIAFEDLCVFINTTLKEGEILKEDEEKLQTQLDETKSWTQATTDEYKNILLKLKEIVKESMEQHRKQAHQSLIDFIEAEIKNDEMLPETKNMLLKDLKATQDWVDGSTNAYQKKQMEISRAVKKSRDKLREKVRNEIIDFIESALAKGRMLENTKLELEKTIKEVNMWNNKTVTQYKGKLQEVEKALENAKEEFRCDKREKLFKFMDSSIILKGLNDTNLLDEFVHIRSSSDNNAAYYESKLDKLKKLVHAENQRVEAHLKLVEFFNLNINLDICQESIESELPSGVFKVEDWKNGTFEEYNSVHGKLREIVQNEYQRIDARDKLWCLIKEERKAGGIFETIEYPAIKDELGKIDAWVSGTTKQYEEKLISVTQHVKDERERREARKKLHKFVEMERKPNGDLFNVSDEQGNQLDSLVAWHNGTTKEYTDEFQKLSKHVSDQKEAERKKAFYNLSEYVENHPQLVTKLHHKQKLRLKNVKNWTSGTTKEYLELLQEMKRHETAEILLLESRRKLKNFIEEEKKPGGKLQIIYDPMTEDKINEILTWNIFETQQYYEAEYEKLKEFLDPTNTTFLFDSDSIIKWKEKIESCMNKYQKYVENQNVQQNMEAIQSYFTLTVPCYQLTYSEKSENTKLMNKTVESIKNAVLGPTWFKGFIGISPSANTKSSIKKAEDDYECLKKRMEIILDTIAQRNQNEQSVSKPSTSDCDDRQKNRQENLSSNKKKIKYGVRKTL